MDHADMSILHVPVRDLTVVETVIVWQSSLAVLLRTTLVDEAGLNFVVEHPALTFNMLPQPVLREGR